MSYLDVPRLHFAGDFCTDPATANNEIADYDPAATIAPGWNPLGKNWFLFPDCTVRSAVNAVGAVKQSPADDALVGGSVETTNMPIFAKLVDLDPEFQTASQVWGLELKVSVPSGSGSFTGRMATATLRDLWPRRAPGGFAMGFGGTYQSVLSDLAWKPAAGSPVLEGLRQASPGRLSIKFAVYAYDANPASQRFTRGRVVGTIGPALPGEPEHFVAARRADAGGSGAYGAVPFKVDPKRNRVVLDLGSAVPETVGGGARRTLGTMEAVILTGPRVALGTIDYTQAHYETTAGVEELAISAAQARQLAGAQLGIEAGARGDLILAERPAGLYVNVTEVAWRMNPGDTRTVEFAATVFGAPRAGQRLALRLVNGTPASALKFPQSVRTGADGRASVTFTAGDPGHPRPHLDGQCYRVAYFTGTATPSNQLGQLTVRVFDRHPSVQAPTWAHARPILEQYTRLYPFMSGGPLAPPGSKGILDLSDHPTVQANREKIRQTLSYPETDPRFMPVTRDLSRDKRDLLLRWIGRGAP